jgi:3-methyladenine DNA glycosylase/8-oxoguanine DNA glycosylase
MNTEFAASQNKKQITLRCSHKDYYRSLISLSLLKNLIINLQGKKLISLKGIGHWTANVYMLVALNRIDIYPDFDVALINSIAHEIFDGNKIDNETAKEFITQFSPLQSIACLYFYHAYIVRKGIQFVP